MVRGIGSHRISDQLPACVPRSCQLRRVKFCLQTVKRFKYRRQSFAELELTGMAKQNQVIALRIFNIPTRSSMAPSSSLSTATLFLSLGSSGPLCLLPFCLCLEDGRSPEGPASEGPASEGPPPPEGPAFLSFTGFPEAQHRQFE